MTEELFDIVDDTDNVIGQAARSDVHRSGSLHRGVHLLLFDSAGCLLIQKRSADRRQYASLWDCSVSEHVKAGESYLEAAIRGAKEELGVDAHALRPLFKFRMEYGPNDNEISVAYEGEVDPARVRFDAEEVGEVAYVGLVELSARMRRRPQEFCKWFLEIMKWHRRRPSALNVLQRWQ
ncbi:MAG: Isopentenyl-diphosphate Delta-isomerase [Anaerolineales bacterium]|nr:Isopentenyl-diphosphate Delta-isomerase [Anaerolineales bacterium]